MSNSKEHGQSMILAAMMVGVLVMFILYLLVNVGGFYRDTRQIDQIATRAARDGTTALAWQSDGLTLAPLTGRILPSTQDNRQCLDVTQARLSTRKALARGLVIVQNRFANGITATSVASDTHNVYLTMAAGNPAGMGCASMGDTHPNGETYIHPWVYIRLTIPVKALFGDTTVLWRSETTVTSATTTRGG